ncbi:YrhB domain-containing protein [Amycolatopsis sp. NPDC101161]|uniref:YrhB domain-containing protein n=1 Tax=Amycolatopsis sp. NPDC101161 TaxID=3363940 RepID=UPI0037F13227
MVITHVDPHRLGWVISSQSERYVRTGAFIDMVVGQGPFLVDGADGSLHMVHATVDLETGGWIEDYLEQVRGLDRVDPLRSRVAELVDSDQRLDALRLVRASAPDLGAQGAKQYVEAAAAGMPVPEEVRARLPRSPVRRRVWWRLSEPNPQP